MRVLHVIPGDNFTEGMGYKDNYLAAINVRDGHEAMILTSCNMWNKDRLVQAEPCDKMMGDGVRLVRRKYKKCITSWLSSKLRVLDGAEEIIEEFQPDVIRVLNPHNLTLPIVVRYKKKNPRTKLYIDSHQEYYNSGKGLLSHWVFHKFLIRRVLRKSLEYIDRVFYCLEGTRVFLKEMYGIPEEKLEFLPMGGFVRDHEERNEIRQRIRAELNITENHVMMVHSGKLTEGKRTREILEAMREIQDGSFRLVLIGAIPVEMQPVLGNLIKSDPRVIFLGWKNAQELEEYIIAADLYLQPGTASATVYKPLCAGVPVVVNPTIEGYEVFIYKGAGWYASTKEELLEVFQEIRREPEVLKDRGKHALDLAKDAFDYRKLAARLYV
jgi:glycosyltransferase involved in cell wall biosynthesis